MAIVFPGLLILVIVFVLAFRLAGGLWSNLVMLGNVIVAALVATNYFELIAGFLANNLSMLAYYADFLAIWVLFAVTLMVLKAVTDIASPVKVRFPKPVETVGNFVALVATGWVLVCFVSMTIHLAPLGRDAFAGGFKPENANFFGFAPDRLWMGFVQRESEGTFATSNVFDAKGDFMVRYASRRERSERLEADPTQLLPVQPAAFPTTPAQPSPPPFQSQSPAMTTPTPSAPVAEPPVETFDAVTAVFTEIDAAKVANVKRPEFGALVDKLSDAITKARETAKTPSATETLDGYAQVLQMYKDSLALWDIKLRLPEMAEVAEKAIKQKTAAGAPDTDPEIMKGYDFNIASLSGIPLQQYPSGDTGVEAIATKYSLPITDRNGWRIVPSDSVSLIWKKASDKLTEVSASRKNAPTMP